MDPVTLGAVLLAAISGASGELGTQLWAAAVALVRRPFGNRTPAGQTPAALLAGDAELAALARDPANERRATALAEVLMARANVDIEFRQALQNWWEQAGTLRSGDGNVTNSISGGTQHGPVLQGRNFGHITFGTAEAQKSPDQRGA